MKQSIGAQPSGKAVVFGTTILGSNPSAPAKIMNKFFENLKLSFYKYFFPFYNSKDIKLLFKNLEKGVSKDKEVAMFVGGCVRNYLQSKKIFDIDIATIFTPDELKKKFEDLKDKEKINYLIIKSIINLIDNDNEVLKEMLIILNKYYYEML